MGRVSTKFNPGESHVLENLEGPYSEDKRIRAERRWKRKEHILNEGSKHNCYARAKGITVKSCGSKTFLADNNVHMVEDEVEEDSKMFLDAYGSHIDVESNNNDIISNTDVSTVYSSDIDTYADCKYKMFLENLRKVGNSYIASVSVNKQLVDIGYEGEVEEKEEEEEEQTGNTVESRQSLETGRGTFNTRTVSDVSGVPKINCDTFEAQCDIYKEEEQIGDLMGSQQSLETERGPMNNCNAELEFVSANEDYKKFLDSYNLQVSDQAFDTPKSQSERGPANNCNADLEVDSFDEDYKKFLDSFNSQVAHEAFDTPKSHFGNIDEDYQLFLNSMIIDSNLVHMQDRAITKTYEGDGGSNSSDTDLILLEPNQIGDNTPFILSKTYHPSWFENETNPGDSRHFSFNDHSEFRRRLMKDLERPYIQEEHDQFLHEVHHHRQKERHVETRQGEVKLYRTKGVNKSYLELYPDLAKAIAKFKESRKVLFLLRGFFFWLQNLTREERFRPWTDKSCLEILQKL